MLQAVTHGGDAQANGVVAGADLETALTGLERDSFSKRLPDWQRLLNQSERGHWAAVYSFNKSAAGCWRPWHKQMPDGPPLGEQAATGAHLVLKTR
jgi:hypothetical protein